MWLKSGVVTVLEAVGSMISPLVGIIAAASADFLFLAPKGISGWISLRFRVGAVAVPVPAPAGCDKLILLLFVFVACLPAIAPVACGRRVVIVALRLVRVGVMVAPLSVWSWCLAYSNIEWRTGSDYSYFGC